MKILVENGCYHLRNMGDVAMLQIAVQRLQQLWPQAQIEVLTDDPLLLKRYVPQAVAGSAQGRRLWFHPGIILGSCYRFVPQLMGRSLLRTECACQRRWPRLAQMLIALRIRGRGDHAAQLSCFINAVMQADLVVVSGGGDLNDSFADFALTMLDVLELAMQHRIPTALVGQGIGPISAGPLLSKAAQVLPKVGLIAVREHLAAPQLLSTLAVDSQRVVVTGDDAIEPAFNAAPLTLGTSLGVNIRMAGYAEINPEILEMVPRVLKQFAERYRPRMLPVPISFHERESDVQSIKQLLAAAGVDSDGGAALDDPALLARQVGRCRLVVTGSYHGAVFALSQGVSAVCLSKSAYYTAKFNGLAAQFGIGCTVVDLQAPDIEERLARALKVAWHSADQVRDALLDAAKAQIDVTHSAYQKLQKLVSH